MQRKFLLFGVLLAGTALNGAALTIGQLDGAAWIGRPLSLSIPVQLDSDSSDTDLCAQADIYYADALQAPSHVQVQQMPAPQTGGQVVHISSASSIDEPMVTVYLRVGCGQQVSRRFVLLADYPSVPASSDTRTALADAVAAAPAVADAPVAALASAAADAPAANEAAAATSAGVPRAKSTAARTAVRATSTKKSTKPRALTTPPKPAPSTHTTPVTVQAPATAPHARLKLDPLEDLSERIKTLESSATAIPPEDRVRDAQRVEQLQSDIKSLLELASKNEATLSQMRERLEKAEAERNSSTLVYALVALLLACLAAIALLWNRRQSGPTAPPGWSNSQQDEDDAPAPEGHHAPSTATAALAAIASAQPVVVAPRKESAIGVGLLEMGVDDDAYDALIHSQPDALVVSAPPVSPAAPLLVAALTTQSFNSDQQFDLCQQAEFLDGLDKTDEAIALLEKRIRANIKDCPLIYLELLRIAHTHSLKTDFRQFRAECLQVFNVNIPEFALFLTEGRALEAYPDLLAHIEKLWHTPKVLEVLESCILRDPWEKNAQPFDLAAFKELVTLHGLASQERTSAVTAEAPATTRDSEATDALDIDLEL